MRSDRFNDQQSHQYISAVAAIRALPTLDHSTRAGASAIAELLRAEWITQNKVKPSRGRVCALRIVGKRHECQLPVHSGFCAPACDHASLWNNEEGKPTVYVFHPYLLRTADLAALAAFCNQWGLRAIVWGHSWYFPGRSLMVEIRKADGKG